MLLAESQSYELSTDCEEVILLDKRTGEKRIIGDHYGDAKCGLISPNEDWFLAGGEGLTYYDMRRGRRDFLRRETLVVPAVYDTRRAIHDVLRPEPMFVHSIKLFSPREALVLIDPWSEQASVWRLNVDDLSIEKLRSGPFLADQPYSDNVEY